MGYIEKQELGEELINKYYNDFILNSKVVVSDTFTYTSSCDNEMVVDEARGLVYMVYLESKTNYGETMDMMGLSVFPIKQPERANFFVVAENNVSIGGVNISSPYANNILNLDSVVRVYFLSGSTYYYRDFNKTSMTFEDNVHIVKLDNSGTIVNFSESNVNSILVSKGFPSATYAFLVSHFQEYNGVIYAAISNYGGNPIVVSSEDTGATWLIRGVVPSITYYETDVAITSDGNMYILNRNATSTSNFYKSLDLGYTFSTGTTFGASDHRPRIVSYKNKLLVLYSETTGDTDLKCVDGRQNIIFKLGLGTDTSTYSLKLRLSSKYGLVYYSVINYKDDIYIAFTNSELYNDINIQAKDLIHFVKIGEFYDDKEFSLNI